MRSTTRPLPRALLVVALAAGVVLSALGSAGATDVDSLRRRAQGVADRVTVLSRRLASLEGKEQRLEENIERTTARIAALELDIHRSRRVFLSARRRYVARAVEAYKEGPSDRLAFVLSARDLSEVLVLAEAAGQMAEDDADALERVMEAAEEAERAQAELDERKQVLVAAEERAETLSADIADTVDAQSATLLQLRDEIKLLEAEARREAARAAAEDETAALEQALAPSSEGGSLFDYGSGPSSSNGGPSNGIPADFVGTGVTFEGIASWYGPGFEGNLTANGDVFDPDKFTAASKELPLGSWLYVEHEGRGVVVLINDRGPYIEGRVLDLSEAAAQAIGISGLGWIKAEVIVRAG